MLRPAQAGDEPALRRVFTDPGVARYWGDPDRSVADSLHPEDGESGFVIELDAQPIGWIQCFEEDDPMYRHASIDLALHSDWQGQGLGPDAIRALARYLVKERGHHRITIDPAAHNTRAISAYERVGFKRVGIMRQYERGPDGEWHDGLLMDMLAEELTE
ncbi:MAG TPA: GNAT family protein [Candidatus Dormibacteraeota bacterium]|nr:GNAT family protein [Candidatus Dormibacteraeota bacterium]